MAGLRLGLIGPWWPPVGGGGEVYLQRIAQAMAARGFEVGACVGVRAPEPAPGVRLTPATLDIDPDDATSCGRWLPQIAAWLDDWRPDVVLINAPWTRVSHGHAAEAYALVRARGCRIGAIHLDLDRGVVEALAAAYAMLGDWTSTAAEAQRQLRGLAATSGAAIYAEIGSPFYFDCDFALSVSQWSDAFIDPLQRYPRVVVRPPMLDAMHGAATKALAPVDFGFVNPRPHKGGRTLAEIVQAAPADWRFRALEGGHGRAFEAFRRDISGCERRVELIDRLDDMRGFYDGLGALLMASLYEGYGMVAVEAMIRGTPVIARDYPAIREAVGEAAVPVPFAAGTEAWIDAMRTVRDDPSDWRMAATDRVAALASRETEELDSLAAFLEAR